MNIALIFYNLDLSLATVIPPAHQTPTHIYTVTAEEMNTAYAKSALKYMQSFLYIKKSTYFIQQSDFQRDSNLKLWRQKLPKVRGAN